MPGIFVYPVVYSRFNIPYPLFQNSVFDTASNYNRITKQTEFIYVAILRETPLNTNVMNGWWSVIMVITPASS